MIYNSTYTGAQVDATVAWANQQQSVNAHGTTSGTVDLSAAYAAHTITADGNIAFTMSGWPASGTFGSIALALANGGAHTITWPAAVDWAGGSAPTLTSSGTDWLVFWTVDGGTTIIGAMSVEDAS